MIASGVKMLKWLSSRRVTKESGKGACACSVVVSNDSLGGGGVSVGGLRQTMLTQSTAPGRYWLDQFLTLALNTFDFVDFYILLDLSTIYSAQFRER